MRHETEIFQGRARAGDQTYKDDKTRFEISVKKSESVHKDPACLNDSTTTLTFCQGSYHCFFLNYISS